MTDVILFAILLLANAMTVALVWSQRRAVARAQVVATQADAAIRAALAQFDAALSRSRTVHAELGAATAQFERDRSELLVALHTLKTHGHTPPDAVRTAP